MLVQLRNKSPETENVTSNKMLLPILSLNKTVLFESFAPICNISQLILNCMFSNLERSLHQYAWPSCSQFKIAHRKKKSKALMSMNMIDNITSYIPSSVRTVVYFCSFFSVFYLANNLEDNLFLLFHNF